MSFHIIFFIIVLLCLHIEATHINDNGTLSEEHRQPRVNGRIIKLYSGPRPEPFLCPSEGFQADPADCTVFYRCVRSNSKYTVFRFQCGPGTIYDPDTEVCNHPQSTKRSECGGRVSSSTEKSHENEIDGANGAQSEIPSPISTKKPVYTDQTTLSAAYPWATSSQHYNSESPQSSSSTANPWITTVINSQNGHTCTSDGFMGDSENCRKFYRCVGNQRGGFIRYEFSCSESTIWDEDIQSCNHPWAVQRRRCGRGNNEVSVKPTSPEQPTNEVAIQQQLQIAYGSKVSQFQTQISNGPVIQNQTQVNRGDHSSQKENLGTKQNQTQISHGSAVSQSQTQIQYGNEGIQTQLQVDHTKQSSQTQTQLYETSSKSSTTITQHDEIDGGYGSQTNIEKEGTKDEDNHNNECTESGFMGDKDDCKKFYRCVDNGRGGYTKYEFSCGEGTVWDSNIEACNHAWAVKECGGKAPNQSSSQSETTTVTRTTTTKASTQNYYTTSELTTKDEEDISYGHQNQQPTSTDSIVQIQPTTTASNSEETKCTSGGFVGDSNDCKKFYRCVDNGKGSFTKYEYECGEKTVWDPDIGACNHAWAVKRCGESSSDKDIYKIDTTTSTEKSVMTTISLVQATTQTSNQNGDYDTGYGQQQSETPSTASILTTNQPNTEGQNESNECKSSGFMSDKNDCKKFFRCVDNGNGSYTRYEFSCGEGTVWDPKIEACNHAWAVEKCGDDYSADIQKETTPKPNPTISVEDANSDNTTPNEKESTHFSQSTQLISTTTSSTVPNESSECQTSGFMGDKNDCKKFYRCVDNGRDGFIRYEFSCGEGTVWDQSIEGCNHAWSVKKCGNKEENNSTYTQVATTIQSSTAATVQSEGNESSSSEIMTTTTSELNHGSTDNVCVTEGFVGDSEDCKQFYRCVENGRGGYIKYEFTCGEGTVWDPQIDACNHPKPNQKCGKKENKPSATEQTHENDEMYSVTTSNSLISSSSSQESDNSETPHKPSASDDATCKSDGFYGDSNDCKKFYRCVDNGKGSFTKYDFKCGDGTIWDQEIQGCNHESSNKPCSKSSTPSQIQSENTEKYTSTISSNTEDQQPSEPEHTKAPSNSNDQCSSEGFFANSNDCKKFYRCVSNGEEGFTKYDFICGEGTVWVQDIQACDHDDGVCTNQISFSETTPVINEQTTAALATSSEMSTQSQIPNKNNDEYPNQSFGDSSAADNENCTNEGFYGDKNDCRRFHRCVDNGRGGYTKYEFTCGEGTAWDSDIQNCNHISEVKSCQNLNQDESQQTKPVVQDEQISETTDNPSTSKTTSASSSVTESSKPSNKDTCDQEGYFGNTEDCKQFYRCVDNGKGGFTKYDFTCGEGTIWDQDITTCNHPQDVTNPSCKQSDGSSSSTSSSESPASSSSSSTPQSTSSTTESNNQGSSNCSQENATKKPENQNVTCSKAGYYANPNDCKKFYRCVDWDGDGKRFSVYHFDCGEGTIWDPALETCNHEDSVYPPRDCSGTQAQNENVNQESTTTEESTTSQENTDTTQISTTQSSTTEDQTSTPQSTTSEQTTTQQTSTKEQTTAQPTTTEETTTQQMTTSEQTTAQQTTSEQTTTEQTTTSEQITTQQSTTTEQTTTQKTTTSEQTTIQQSTTSEQTTTQQSTTSEQTTAQPTTTEQTTTSEQSTTQQTTTSEQITQESTTEQSTTQQSTTEQTTTQKSGEETTTEQSSITEQSTTTEKSDEQSTTEQSTEETTQESTTEQQTTESGSTTQQTDYSSTTESGQDSTTESSSSSNKDCPETEDDQNLFVCPTSFRRHPKYCNLFYQCTEDDDNHDIKIAVFNCPNNTIYDESQTKCVEENKAGKKCDGEIAQRRRVKRLDTTYKEPIDVSKASLKCPTAGYFPFQNEECSSAFLKCNIAKSGKLRGFIYQCPEGYVYWSVSRRCEKKSSVRFCKQSYNNWNERWEIPIERRNVAP